jgi:ATP-dependent DNA ligase
MPGFIKPQFDTLKTRDPTGDQWLHEIKFDGYRVQIHLNKGKRRVYTRNGLDWTKRFSVIAGALDIPGHAIIDGEVVVHEGRTNFSELQAELAADPAYRDGEFIADLAVEHPGLGKTRMVGIDNVLTIAARGERADKEHKVAA